MFERKQITTINTGLTTRWADAASKTMCISVALITLDSQNNPGIISEALDSEQAGQMVRYLRHIADGLERTQTHKIIL